MKIATRIKDYNISKIDKDFEIEVEEEKEFDMFKSTREFQKILNKEFNNCIKISNIKFNIRPQNTSDSIDVAIDLDKTNLQNF